MKKILILALVLLSIVPFVIAAPQPQLELTGKQMIPLYGAPWIGDNSKFYLGNDKDAYIQYNTTTAAAEISGIEAVVDTGALIAAGEDVTFAGGDSLFDAHLSSGIFKTTTGAVTIGPGAVGLTGTMTVAATKDIIAASTGSDFDFSASTDGIFKTPGGAITIGPGAVALSGSPTVATGKTLAVVDADKLTVGGIIVPQYWDFNTPIVNAASVDTNIFIPTASWQVVAISEAHTVAGNNASPVNVTVVKCTSTQTPAQGSAMAAVIDLKGTANTIVSPTVSTGSGLAKINATERIALKFQGTLTTLAGGTITVRLKRI